MLNYPSLLTTTIILFLRVQISLGGSTKVGPVLTKYDHFSKHLTIGAISTGGRLQTREIGYIAQAGFASILSVVEFNTSDASYKNITGDWPSSENEKSTAQSYGLAMEYFASSLTVDSVNTASAYLTTMPKPIFVHCHVISMFLSSMIVNKIALMSLTTLLKS